MVVEWEPLPFWDWLIRGRDGAHGALLSFVIILAVLGVASFVISYLVMTVRYGPMQAGDRIYRVVANAFSELFQLSPRRIWALARLAVQEASRRRIVVALILFVVILLFAGWFLKTDYKEPGRLFFSFVLTATIYLVLGIALLLSAFSLPADIKSKTIHTVITKPVRAAEIILGRVLGFTLVGTVLLVVMGICSYWFVIRSLDHTHFIEASSLEPILGQDNAVIGREGQTTQNAHHRHLVEQDERGEWKVSANYGHTHSVKEDPSGSAEEFELSAPEGFTQARVPKYGKLTFKDRHGGDKDRGISVGNEWTYRSFIDGNTAAAAIWTFSGISEERYPRGLELELLVRVFRTHKGIIEQRIRGEIFLQNPETDLRCESRPFTAKDGMLDARLFERQVKDTRGERNLDLFQDLVSEDGQIEVWVRCLDNGQYFGFAQADCYLRLGDASPMWNFWKSQISIWVQMVLVIAIGVTCSTLVSGPIAALFTAGFVLLGLYRADFLAIAEGPKYGGGPVESLYRIATQMNMISPLPQGPSTSIIQGLDQGIQGLMWVVAQVLPNFPRFNTTNYIADGFNIPMNQVAQDLLICLAYVSGLVVVGYFFLRTREVAK
ncbi:MAG: ABC transporter permease [Pirellulales bacterium]|nr:ABC transporter permease [Pirellulales bacterium]